MNKENLTCVGKFASPHGVRGAVKLYSYTSIPESILEYSPLYNKNGDKEYEISLISSNAELLVVKVGGVFDRNDAAKLVNTELYADRDLFDELEEDEFFYDDLIGLAVILESGEKFGEVKAAHDFGGENDVLEVLVGKEGKTEMFLFTKENFPEIRLAEGEIVINPPEFVFVQDNDN